MEFCHQGVAPQMGAQMHARAGPNGLAWPSDGWAGPSNAWAGPSNDWAGPSNGWAGPSDGWASAGPDDRAWLSHARHSKRSKPDASTALCQTQQATSLWQAMMSWMTSRTL